MIFLYDGNHLQLDAGWKKYKKGYIKTIGTESIKIDTIHKKVYLNTFSIPYYYNDNTLSSFPFPKLSLIPYDHDICFDSTLSVVYNHKKNISSYTKEKINVDNFVEFIIDSAGKTFDTNTKYLIPQSHGLDSTTVQAIMDYYNIDYKPYKVKGFSKNKFYNQLQQIHWGFRQTPYYKNSVSIVTGFYGDEYILRNPVYVQYRLFEDNIDLHKQFLKFPNSYMHDFYMMYYKKKTSSLKVNQNYLQIILNDWQMWHVNNCQIVNPFFNKEILFKGLSLDADSIIKQSIDGFISKEIIKRTNPKLLTTLDNKKNASDPLHFDYRFIRED